MQSYKLSSTILVAAVVCWAAVVQAVTIETAPVGNPGNAADTTGYGSVGYAYNIGKYEVTAGQYTAFLNAVAKTDTYELYNPAMCWENPSGHGCMIQRSGSPGSYTYSVASDRASRPADYVSFWDAIRFANWLHNGQPSGAQGPGTTESGAYHDVGNQLLFGRNADSQWFLPTENEWYKAGYHKNDGDTGNYFKYPTGSNTTPSNTLGNLNDTGNTATFQDNLAFTIGSPFWRTEVGSHENSASPYGTFDQGGNVFEWNEMPSDSTDPVIRGGPWSGYSSYLDSSFRQIYYPTYEQDDLGFRVASVVPEPGSVAMLIGIALTALLSWVRKPA